MKPRRYNRVNVKTLHPNLFLRLIYFMMSKDYYEERMVKVDPDSIEYEKALYEEVVIHPITPWSYRLKRK